MNQHQELSAKLNQQAIEQLAVVKKQESELLNQGWHYIRIDERTLKLVPPNNHYCVEHDDFKELAKKCNKQCEYCKSI